MTESLLEFQTDAAEALSKKRSIEHLERRGVVIGMLAAVRDSGEPLVVTSANAQPIPARSTLTVGEDQIGRDAVLMFENGDPDKPIIMGILSNAQQRDKSISVKVDGESLVLNADREIVLRCGKSSITLTRAGKILIRGAYLLSRSSGVNRIKGGSVQIN